ncbi:hypothetical protein KDH_72200 [Dictyobacter sp. S3.2.2.5]|uniref:non-specific serine/threonine protein kinase n=1 Tax=Dictyobacter halimunensis TaxID=3026934 RepID=A0ABQ6G1J5_9CHLR|nr:hypothetical protein KDH_72200 [Dictyobacter sp. S3.2.2.5]
MTDLVGQQLKQYRLTHHYSQGALADVYLAEHIRSQRQTIIKIKRTPLAEGESKVFLQEAARIARLAHPHIVPVLDFGMQQDGRPFVIQRYTPDGSLRTRYSGGVTIHIDVLVDYVDQITTALQYAHQKGYIHGNLKPGNIMRTKDKVLLADFSLTAITGGTEKLDQLETALYAAPERIQDEPTPASDQYALATMIYEWICGDPLFEGSPLEVIQQHIHDDPASLRAKMPEVSRELEWVIMTALAKEPAQRFSNIQEFNQAFKAACEEEGLVSSESTRVFFSYAQRDQSLRDQLENHLSNLKYRGLITTWNAREIKAGENAIQQMNIHLNTAHIILLLISANFLASDYCYSQEMMQAIKRHQDGKAHVIPVLLRPVVFTDAPFAHLKPLPSNQKPVVTWRNRDSAFVDIALGIERIVNHRRKAMSLDTASPGYTSTPSRQTTTQRSIPEPQAPALEFEYDHAREEAYKQRQEAYRREQEEYRQRQEAERRRAIAASGLSTQEYEYFEQAIAAYTHAIYSIDSNDAAAWRGRGHAQAAIKLFEEALQDFEEARQLAPDAETYVGIGDVLVALERWDEAIEVYQQALALDESSASAYAGLSTVLYRLHRIRDAAIAYKRARRLGIEG